MELYRPHMSRNLYPRRFLKGNLPGNLMRSENSQLQGHAGTGCKLLKMSKPNNERDSHSRHYLNCISRFHRYQYRSLRLSRNFHYCRSSSWSPMDLSKLRKFLHKHHMYWFQYFRRCCQGRLIGIHLLKNRGKGLSRWLMFRNFHMLLRFLSRSGSLHCIHSMFVFHWGNTDRWDRLLGKFQVQKPDIFQQHKSSNYLHSPLNK